MAKKELVNTEKAITGTEEEAIKEWKNMFQPSFNKVPTIYIDNKKFTEDDKKNPNFGKIYAVRSIEGNEEKKEISAGTKFFPIIRRVQVSCRDYVEEITVDRGQNTGVKKLSKDKT